MLVLPGPQTWSVPPFEEKVMIVSVVQGITFGGHLVLY